MELEKNFPPPLLGENNNTNRNNNNMNNNNTNNNTNAKNRNNKNNNILGDGDGVEEEGVEDREKIQVPVHFSCPITFELMRDPVFIASGHTYDRRSIAKWFQQGHKTCPSTGQRLRNTEITPNFALRNAILEWAKETKFLVDAEGEELLRNVSQKPTVQIGGTLQFGDDLEHDDDVDDDDSEGGRRRMSTDGGEGENGVAGAEGGEEAAGFENVRGGEGGGANVYDTIDDDRIETAINNLARRNPNITGDAAMGGEPSPSAPEHTVLEGHEEIVWAVETTNSLVFTASADKTVRVWDIPSRRCVHVLEEHTRPVLSLAVSTRHKRLFSGSYDCTVRVWDITTFRRMKVLSGHTDAVRALVIHEVSKSDKNMRDRLFTGSYDHTIRAFDVVTLEPLAVLTGHGGPVRTLVVALDRVFSGSYDKTIRVWDAVKLKEIKALTGHKDAVRALIAHKNINKHSMNATTKTETTATANDEANNDTISSSKNPIVLSGSDDSTVRAWDARTLKCLQVCVGHEDNVRVLALDSRFLYSGSWDKTIRCWDLQNNLECVKVITGHTEAVLALAVMQGHVVSGSYDTTVRFWNANSFSCAGMFEGHEDAVRVLASTGEGATKVYSGSYDGSVGFWSLPTALPARQRSLGNTTHTTATQQSEQQAVQASPSAPTPP
jgi:F-box/WD-40 domain protein 7